MVAAVVALWKASVVVVEVEVEMPGVREAAGATLAAATEQEAPWMRGCDWDSAPREQISRRRGQLARRSSLGIHAPWLALLGSSPPCSQQTTR